MINILFTVVSLAVLVVAVATKGTFPSTTPTHEEVLSAKIEDTSRLFSVIPTQAPFETATVSPTLVPIKALQPTPQSSMNSWTYRGATFDTSIGEDTLSFTATDSAKMIVTWYKNKMLELGFSPKSIIQTNSNERVLDKLNGDGIKGSVSVEISQDSAVSPVKVVVLIHNSNTSI